MAQSSITITIKLFAIYQEVYGVPELTRQVPQETTVSNILSELIEEHPQLKKWQDITRFSVNYQFVEADTKLQDGDELVFIPPVSGG
ncbi:MoaD/ThiS family protein [Crocosphaera chwakensis]|uniref:MoaD/ThiS family protein n=1 Tax=Crocosphaera chwakensis TaxID=2546361 RepID=UPI0002D3BB0C|nr:MoaD/ThiS family protein [Crocosphaera chwakensis]